MGDPAVRVMAASGRLHPGEVAEQVVQEERLPFRPDQDRVGALPDRFEAGNLDHVVQGGVILSGQRPEFNAPHPLYPGRSFGCFSVVLYHRLRTEYPLGKIKRAAGRPPVRDS